MPVIADSRDRIGAFQNAVIKPNELEACRFLGLDPAAAEDTAAMKEAALALEKRCGRPALITLGDRGVLWAEGGRTVLVPAYQVPPPIFSGIQPGAAAGNSPFLREPCPRRYHPENRHNGDRFSRRASGSFCPV